MRNFILTVLFATLFAASLGGAFYLFRDTQTQTRGVSNPNGRTLEMGVNVTLEQYADADLNRALALIRDGGFKIVRQHFYWNDLEPQRGQFVWDKSDRIIARAREYNLDVVAVIDTTPTWARDVGEADLLNAPPKNPDDYARFVAAFIARYKLNYIQVWDNPNVHPFWGRRNAEPFEYVALLRATALAVRAANPNVKIISAGLASSEELIRGHPDYSDVLYLRGMYDADARPFFDILGAKAYGMWSGPEDRRVAIDVLNFSRAILLREEMVTHGDANKPVWAVEFGWNALPSDWRGKGSPWGTDTEATQAKRLLNAIRRAQSEWGWMNAMLVQHFQPNAPSDDPVLGFALVDPKMQVRAPLFNATAPKGDALSVGAIPGQPFALNPVLSNALVAILMIVALVSAWRAWVAFDQLAWRSVYRALEARFIALPEIVQFVVMVIVALAFYYSRSAVLNFGLLAALIPLFAFRLDLALVVTIFTAPFYLLPKNLIGGAQFSLAELFTLASVVALVIRSLVSGFKFNLKPETWNLKRLDLAIIFFTLAGIVSIAVASNFGVANREWRVVVIEPALFYVLIRASNLSHQALTRIVLGFVASALEVALIGLYQYAFTDWVIIGEGVRRILAIYGSPNNVALLLDRALPLVLALMLFSVNKWHRIAYGFIAFVFALCLYLTYSRGAWLIGMPVGLVVLGLLSGRRARIAVIVLLVVAALALIPFLQTERAQSLFQSGTGTGFFRVSVWESGWRMILDHPILGVGLDNFLYQYPKYINPDAWREPNLSHPHNVVLDFWARMGIPGLFALGWMLFEFYRSGIKGLRGTERALVIGLLASMTAALAHGMIDAAYFYADLAFGWMMTLGIVQQVET